MNQNNKNLDFSKDFESTNLSTNSPVQNFSLKKEEFKRKYQDKNRLLNFLKTNNPAFSEDFELIKFVSAGATGVVYEGKMRKKKNAANLAFKFKISKRGNKDK